MRLLKLFSLLAFFFQAQLIFAQTSSVPFQDPDGILWGLKDSTNNKILVQPIYENIRKTNDKEILIASVNGKFGLITMSGLNLSEFKYDYIDSKFYSGLIKVFVGTINLRMTFRAEYYSSGNYGLINKKGEELISTKYFRVVPCQTVVGDFFKLITHGRMVGVIDTLGNEISGFKYNDINCYKNGLIRVFNGEMLNNSPRKGKYGFINSQGKIIIPIIYDEAKGFVYNNTCKVKKDDKWHFINEKGKKLRGDYTNGVYSKQKWFSGKVKYGYRDLINENYIRPKYDYVKKINDSLYAGLEGLYAPDSYDNRSYGRWYFLNKNGRKLPDKPFVNYEPEANKNYEVRNLENEFNNIDFKIRKDSIKKYSILDASSNALFPFSFNTIGRFKNTPLFIVYILNKKKNKYNYLGSKRGLINHEGKLVLPIKDYIQLEFIEYNGVQRIILRNRDTLNDNQRGYVYLIDLSGNLLSNPYEEIKHLDNGLFKVTRKGKYGIINLNGKETVPSVYININERISERLSVTNDKHKNGVISYNNREIVPIKYSNVYYTKGFYQANNSSLNDSHFYSKTGKLLNNTNYRLRTIPYDDVKIIFTMNSQWINYPQYGVLDYNNDTIIPAIYYNVIRFQRGIYKAVANRETFILDSLGKEVIPKELRHFKSNEWYQIVSGKQGYGVYSLSGKQLIPAQYDKITDISDSVLIVEKSGKSFLMNCRNNSVISDSYNKMKLSIYKNNFLVENDSLQGAIDFHGKEIIPTNYDVVTLRDDYSLVIKNGKKGLYHKRRGMIVPVDYDEINWNNTSKGAVFLFERKDTNHKYEGKWTVVDTNGNKINDSSYSLFSGFDNYHNHQYSMVFNGDTEIEARYGNERVVPLKGKYGIINRSGYEVIAMKHDFIRYNLDIPIAFIFKGDVDTNGCLQKGKWGVVTKQGKKLTRYKFDWVSDFMHRENLVITFKGTTSNGNPIKGKYGIFSYSGKELVKPVYEQIYEFHDYIAMVKKNNLYGYINNFGEKLTPCIYSKASHFNNGKALVELNGESFFLNREGVRID